MKKLLVCFYIFFLCLSGLSALSQRKINHWVYVTRIDSIEYLYYAQERKGPDNVTTNIYLTVAESTTGDIRDTTEINFWDNLPLIQKLRISSRSIAAQMGRASVEVKESALTVSASVQNLSPYLLESIIQTIKNATLTGKSKILIFLRESSGKEDYNELSFPYFYVREIPIPDK